MSESGESEETATAQTAAAWKAKLAVTHGDVQLLCTNYHYILSFAVLLGVLVASRAYMFIEVVYTHFTSVGLIPVVAYAAAVGSLMWGAIGFSKGSAALRHSLQQEKIAITDLAASDDYDRSVVYVAEHRKLQEVYRTTPKPWMTQSLGFIAVALVVLIADVYMW